jgi:hypothetical protein
MRRRRYLQSGAHPGGHVGWDAVGVKQTGPVERGPELSQQSWPDRQHAVPQQRSPGGQSIPTVHGSTLQVLPLQYGVSGGHLLLQLPQLVGSFSGLMHFPLQQRRYIPHDVAVHGPASAPPLDELVLDPPELLLEVFPPLDELPTPPLLDALDMPPEVPEPLDPPWPLLLPPEALPEPCPEELPPEPPLDDPPPLVEDVVASTEASPGGIANSAPPQRTATTATASNGKYLRLPRFMLDPQLTRVGRVRPKVEPAPVSATGRTAAPPRTTFPSTTSGPPAGAHIPAGRRPR